MAASNRKRTVKKGKNSRGTTSRQETAGFQTEIILFVILAACVILPGQQFRNGRLCRGCHQSFLLWADGNDGISFSRHFLCRGSLYSDQ